MDLKCYVGGSYDPFEYEYVEACFAESRKEAKRLLWKHTDLPEECDHEWMNARVVRKKEYDALLDPDAKSAYVVTDRAVLRQMHWGCEDDMRCEACGLAEMNGDWPVCDDCGQCPDCGHDDECSEGSQVAA